MLRGLTRRHGDCVPRTSKYIVSLLDSLELLELASSALCDLLFLISPNGDGKRETKHEVEKIRVFGVAVSFSLLRMFNFHLIKNLAPLKLLYL
jgi:hypothetical protein